ncbi:hypothetical protein AB0H83_51460 [Dactylosporangium sp. NPDC050688]|uniref:hypothetical protein n=1 Tax=Dactylosporangium sp. NPDC050688 TaxID=3157217 RepID=UPI0033F63C3F
MARSLKLSLSLNLGVLVLAAAVMGTVPLSTATGGGHDSTALQLATDQSSKEYPSINLVSKPAPASASAKVNAQEAVHRTKDLGFSTEMIPGSPIVELRLISEKYNDPTLTRDYFTDRLTWVVTYKGSRVIVHGPLNLDPSVRRQATENLRCEVVFFIDAATAEAYKGALQTC